MRTSLLPAALLPAALLAATFSASPASAQDLTLSGEAGSVPGTFALRLGEFATGARGAVLIGASPGPTPLAWIDPGDTRQLDVGLAPAPVVFSGFFLVDRHFSLPVIPVPNDPGLLGGVLHAQGFQFPGTTRLIGPLSNPIAVRMGRANTFVDRRTVLNLGRAFPAMLPVSGGRWMIAGGGSGALLAQIATKTTEIHDPVTDTWSKGPDMLVEHAVHTATELADGRWLIVGGVNSNNDPIKNCEIWDPAKGGFTAAAPLALQRMGHSATLLPDGRVFVAGGLTDLNANSTPLDPIFSATNTTEIYDPKTNRWTAGPTLKEPRAGHSVVLSAKGKVVLAGGIGYRTIIIIKVPAIWSSVDLFDPTTNQITAGAGMATARALATFTPLGADRYLIAGGASDLSDLSQPGKPTDRAEIYDASANSWAATGNMVAARGFHAAVPAAGNKILLLGGGNGSVLNPVPLASTEIYDPATGRFTAGPTMNAPRAAFGVWMSPTGQAHVVGGGGTSTGVLRTTEWYYR